MSLAEEIQEDFLEEGRPVVFGRKKGDPPLHPQPPPRGAEVSRERECQVGESLSMDLWLGLTKSAKPRELRELRKGVWGLGSAVQACCFK